MKEMIGKKMVYQCANTTKQFISISATNIACLYRTRVNALIMHNAVRPCEYLFNGRH